MYKTKVSTQGKPPPQDPLSSSTTSIKRQFPAFFNWLCSAGHPGLCLSQPCITVASVVMGGLDRSVDPCSDFYNYACGGWMKSNPLPEGKSRWGTFSNLWEQNMLVMKHLLGKSSDQRSISLKMEMFCWSKPPSFTSISLNLDLC